MNKTLFTLLGVLSLFLSSADAQLFGGPSQVEVTLAPDKSVVAPGETVNLVVSMTHSPGFNTYWINPGIGSPTDLGWSLPPGYETGKTFWEIPKVKDSEFGTNHIFVETSHIVTPLVVPSDAQPGKVQLSLEANWLECDANGCRPNYTALTYELTIGESSQVDAKVTEIVEKVMSEQPQELSAWKIEYGGDDSAFVLELIPGEGANTDPGDIYFFEANTSPALKHEMPKVEKSGSNWVLTMAKNEAIDSAEVKGFLYAPNGWATVDGKKVKALGTASLFTNSGGGGGAVATEKAVEKNTHSMTSAEDIAAGAALYDVDARPDYVLLGGGKEGNLTLLPALGLIFLAGMLLNLMPCVFPVLAIKVMGFVSQGGENPRVVKAHGLVFALGVLVSMWVLASIIIALKLDWGAQMQNPVFVAGIIILMFILGLNLTGTFEIGTSLAGVGGAAQEKSGYGGSFFSGILTTLIATPCSGPFLGAVMTFALSQKAGLALLVFTFFAAGIAFPYVLLSFFPKLIEKLPPPGAWMEKFKKGMSFALFATAVFFLGAFAKLTGFEGTRWLLFGLVVIGLAFWIYGTWGTPFMKVAKRVGIGYCLALLVAIGGFWMVKTAVAKEAPQIVNNSDWEDWYPGVVELSKTRNEIVWVDYTAEW